MQKGGRTLLYGYMPVPVHGVSKTKGRKGVTGLSCIDQLLPPVRTEVLFGTFSFKKKYKKEGQQK